MSDIWREGAITVRALWTTLALAVVLSCTSPLTGIRVRVTSDIEYGPGQPLRAVSVRFRFDGHEAPTRSCGCATLDAARVGQGTWRLPYIVGARANEEDVRRSLWIEVLGWAEPDCSNACGSFPSGTPIGAQRAIVTLREGILQEITMDLSRVCQGILCSPVTTCQAGVCVSAIRPTGSLCTVNASTGVSTCADGGVDASGVPDVVDDLVRVDAANEETERDGDTDGGSDLGFGVSVG